MPTSHLPVPSQFGGLGDDGHLPNTTEERRTDWSQYANETTAFEKEYQGRLLAAVHKVMLPRSVTKIHDRWVVNADPDGFQFVNLLHGFDRTFLLSLAYPASRALQYDLVRLEALLTELP